MNSRWVSPISFSTLFRMFFWISRISISFLRMNVQLLQALADGDGLQDLLLRFDLRRQVRTG